MNYELLLFATLYKFDAMASSPSAAERQAAEFIQACHDLQPSNSAALLIIL